MLWSPYKFSLSSGFRVLGGFLRTVFVSTGSCVVVGGTWVVGGGTWVVGGCTVPLCTWSFVPPVGKNDSLVFSRCRRLRRNSRPLSVTTLYDLGPAGPITDARSGHLSIRRSMSCMRTTSCGCRGGRLFPPLMSIGGLATASRRYWRQGSLVLSFGQTLVQRVSCHSLVDCSDMRVRQGRGPHPSQNTSRSFSSWPLLHSQRVHLTEDIGG